MSAPSILPAQQAFSLPANLPRGTEVYEVHQSGRFGDQVFSKGERLLVEGAPECGDAVVLVARGPGRPRLGWVRSTGLVGDCGEPCLSRRWRAAGRLVGIARPLAGGWQVTRFDEPDLVGMVRDVRAGQLELFAA